MLGCMNLNVFQIGKYTERNDEMNSSCFILKNRIYYLEKM